MKLTKKQVLIGGGVVVLLAAAVGLGLLTQQLLKTPSKEVPASNVGGTHLPTVVDEAQTLRSTGHADEAAKKVDAALAQSNLPNDTKHLLYIEKGLAALDTQKYQAALDAFNQAAAVEQNTNVYRLIGQTDYQLGKKADAVTAYKKAIDLINPDSPAAGSTKTDLQQSIDGISQEIKQ